MRRYDKSAPRRAVNLSLNGELVADARRAKLNLSAIAEEAIDAALARVAAEQFQREIARSVAEHAAYLDEYGSLADALRSMNGNGTGG